MKTLNTTTGKVFGKRNKRLVSMAVIAGMLNTVSLPVQAAIQQEQRQAAMAAEASHDSAWEQLGEVTAQHSLMVSGLKLGRSIHKASWYENAWDKVTSLFTDDAETVAEREHALSTVDQVLGLRIKVMQEQTALMQQMKQDIESLQQQRANPEAIQRQAALIKQVNERYFTLVGLLNKVYEAHQQGSASLQQQALQQLSTQVEAWQPKKAQTDMKNLPWATPDSKVRAPITADNNGNIQPAAYSLGTPDLSTTTSRQDRSSSIGQWRSTEYQFAQYMQQQQAVRPIANTLSGTTASGDWPVLKALPATVQDADLQANEDVSISPEIQQLAKDLNYNPAKIYKWVYDNIEYVPTYGSIQGAAYTLQTKRGNGFDTSSLLIALLRASKVPARYVYGTIEVPANVVKDWVGGVNSIDAAQNLLGQGGVPNIGLTSGSQVVAVQMEHVWVEAALPFTPSRGGLNHAAADGNVSNPDAARQWVPLDASYKRYNRTAGVDIAKAVPFNAEQLLNDVKTGASIDEATGSVQNIDQSKIDTAITAYNNQVKTYLEQNYPNATVGDILGKTEIRPYQSKLLSPVLPYKVNTVIADYQVLPDNLRSYFVVKLYQSLDEKSQTTGMGEQPAFSVRIPTTRLQGKPLALSFKPGSKTDEDTLLSYLPKPDASGNVDLNQLPTSFSSSSIRLVPELTLNGEVLKSTNSYNFGQDVNLSYGFEVPNKQLPLADKTVHSGEYHAIGYNLQGMSSEQLQSIKAQLEQAKAKIESKDAAQLTTLTKHDLTGAMLQAGVQSYFAINQTQDDIAQKQANMIGSTYFSFGTFSTNMQPNVRYGVTLSAKIAGMMMDIDRLSAIRVDSNNDKSAWIAFNAAQGSRHSANEHLVPEGLFNDPNATTKNVNGVSAVKALQVAAQQGQKIFTITQANINTVLPLLQHKATIIEDIQNAVAAGKVVTISQTTVSQNGWTGVGYAVVDPSTGAGAYLIGGAADGGWFLFWFSIVILSLSLFAIVASMFVGGWIPILLGLAGGTGWYQSFKGFLELGEELSKISDIKTADEKFNAGLRDIILPIFLGWILGKTIGGLGGNNEYEEDLFMLIINDIIFAYMYS